MSKHGRKTEEKIWGTSFRHVFNTNYLTDPDLHILLFISGNEVNNVMRQALREYMTKHHSKAADTEFQARVFMAASMQVAKGVRPAASEIVVDMAGAGSSVQEIWKGSTAKRADTSPLTPHPAPPLAPLAAQQVKPPMPTQAAALEIKRSEKPKIELDLGPELEMEMESGLAENDETPKASLKSKWLQNHKY